VGEATELVQSTIDKMLERVDALAQKLGLAATQIWGFTVKANIVNAKRDIATAAAFLIVPALLCGWSIHVLRMRLPHETHVSIAHTYAMRPCPAGATCWGGNYQVEAETPVTEDKGLETEGWLLAVSGLLTAIAAIITACCAVTALIEAISCIYTAEYDAYKDLIYDLKD
jgi:hypothetical protein